MQENPWNTSEHPESLIESPDSLRDHFLIAMPALTDSIFSHSVTYICDHSDQGAMGIVINHPLELKLSDVFDQLDIDYQPPLGLPRVLAGGPVNTQRGFVLHRDEGIWESTLRITSEISLTASRDIVTAIAKDEGPKHAQFALGYAGWAPGQLEEEINDNAWLVVRADTGIIFDTPVEERWGATAKQLGIDLNLISSTAGHA
ncbi:YqgE/AlgH family protein [Teredinibacter purpureus]|uniref:YqgE/AlgH family protein n=1 Tax=Teredinibacter purpureus TaxID=2731756 RepID=UPI0005F82B0A|nr:YqgE/AlgH family protein [Teredinibacter purpureus]